MRQLVVMLVIGAIGAAGLAGTGGARDGASTFACPNPARAPLGKAYDGYRGTTFCNDGASASATVGGKQLPKFTGGVCFTDSTGFNVEIGTSIVGKRKPRDPRGFELLDFKPGGLVKDSVHLGSGTTSWGYAVKLTKTARGFRGEWSGTQPGIPRVAAHGTFTCVHILRVPG